MSELKETVKVCEGLYSGSIYELETWVRTEEQSEWTKENLLREMQENGRIPCAFYRRTVGAYSIRERADEALGGTARGLLGGQLGALLCRVEPKGRLCADAA